MKKVLAICLCVCLLVACQGALAADSFQSSAVYSLLESTLTDYLAEFTLTDEYLADNKIWSISIDAPEGCANALAAENQKTVKTWKSLTENLSDLIAIFADILETGGYGSVLCQFIIRSDSDDDSILFSNVNGITMYDVLDD